MYLAFYRGAGIFASIVRWWTGSAYAHVELGFSDGMHFVAAVGRKTGWEHRNRVCDLLLEVPCTAEQEAQARMWCAQQTELPYDWYGILISQVFNLARPHAYGWFCSESCVAVLQHIGLLPAWLISCAVSPGQLVHIWESELYRVRNTNNRCPVTNAPWYPRV